MDLRADVADDEGRLAEINWTLQTFRLDELTDYYKNPRSLSEKEFKQLKTSLDKFGMIDKPIVNLDSANTIIGGHQRKHVMESTGAKEIECWIPDRLLTDKEVEELNIRLNKNTGSWDFDTLANEFQLDDLLDWGFDKGELDLDLWADEAPEDVEPQIDKAEELQEKWKVKPGDLWVLGNHKLICGDSTDREIIKRLLNGDKVDAVLTDPPYGVGVDYGSFQDTPEEVKNLIHKIMPILLEFPCAALTPGVPSMWEYPQPAWVGAWIHPAPSGGCSWGFAGTNPILYYGADPYLKEGKGRRPDSVSMASDREGEEGHPTPKPIKVWDWMVEKVTTGAGKIIFDPFLGSGTTLIACERLGRKCRAVEISPAYVAVAIQRWVDVTGKEPVLLDT